MSRRETPVASKSKRTGSLVYVVLDKSGSMSAIRAATVKGVSQFIRDTGKADPVAAFHLSMFDTAVTKVFSGEPISSVESIEGQYNPGGGTALLDAIGRAVKEVEDLPAIPKKVVFVIMTDGQENESREYTREAVKSLIERHEDKDNWQFLFLGANLDAFDEAGKIGMRNAASTSATWQPTARGATAMYMSSSTSTSNYLSGATATASLTQDDYDSAFASLDNTVDAPDVAVVDTASKPKRRDLRTK